MHKNRLKVTITRSILTLTTLLMLAGLLATSALGAPLSGENPAPSRVVYTPNDVWMWSLERVDAPRLFFNMTDHTIRADSGGAVHVAYGGDHLYYARYDGTDWKANVVDGAFGVGQHASLALDKNKYAHISYYDYYNGALKYARFTGTSWAVRVIDAPVSTAESNLLTEEDFVVGSWQGSDKPTPEWRSPALQADAPSAFLQTDSGLSVSAITGVGEYSSIGVDGSGYIHISYYDAVNRDLKYATNKSGDWVISLVDSTGRVGKYSSIAIDSNNRPHISYFDESNDNLKYAIYDGDSWDKDTVPSEVDTIEGGYTSIAVDSGNRPHISYYDSGAGNLLYAVKRSGNWIVETVDSNNDVGGFTSIALDDDENPHISYYNFSNQNLRYAKRGSTTWSTSSVTTDGEAGQFTSITLDKDDVPI